MTWKKTVISNKYSKQELLNMIQEYLSTDNLSVSICDMYTDGTISTELSELLVCPGEFKGSIASSCLDSVNVILGVCDCDNPEDFIVEEKMSKACERMRQIFRSTYSLFITHERHTTKDDEIQCEVGICVQSRMRTYSCTISVSGEDWHYTRSQVRYKALYELARIIYNECNQAIPVKERKMVF